ncbi:hypothetical protein DFQ05_1202 [Winogradskyella wandonensis]|uniref:Uncharacterized protein n=1 Tax=Winogradskyella wandonensis TaxID=1442586 RepID=A0A4R1KQU3_9FLAO|nr:hypothetical protein [Winogradskyella wandonensis]TCK67426.1 hypothetical protein DFQ05_1202 [Winogradskyella wandonensis]
MKNIISLFLLISAQIIYSQGNTVTVGNGYSNYVKIVDIYNFSKLKETVVKLKFSPKTAISATLHAPSGTSPFVLTDKKGNRYALKAQVGWKGNLASGFGTINLKANETKTVSLYFNQVSNIEDIYSLTEVDCSSTTSCWNFYDIKVKKGNSVINTSTIGIDKSKVSAKYEKTWLENDVFDSNNKFGIRIHNKFFIYGLKGKSCYLTIRIMEGDKFIKSTQFGYKNVSGQLEIKKSLKPGFSSAVYNDKEVFLPYELLSNNLPIGKHNLKIDVDLFYKDGTLLKHLGFKEFVYTKR